MKKKLLTLLTSKCKDMGLTEKALGELVELGSEGLADDASDEDIAKKVDSRAICKGYAGGDNEEDTEKAINHEAIYRRRRW